MAFDKSFSITELTIGSLKNIIGIDDGGNMTFEDGSVGPITLTELAGIEVTLDTLVDTEGAVVDEKYNLKKTANGWTIDVDSITDSIVIMIEMSDWVADGLEWTVDVPHNLNLTLPANLLSVQLWDSTYTNVTDNTITQSVNAVTIKSTTRPVLYITMR